VSPAKDSGAAAGPHGLSSAAQGRHGQPSADPGVLEPPALYPQNMWCTQNSRAEAMLAAQCLDERVPCGPAL